MLRLGTLMVVLTGIVLAALRYWPPERMSDAELHEALLAIWIDTLADPQSTPEELQHAATMLALPWDDPAGKWTVAQTIQLMRAARDP
jgi:hypothetical protein